MPWLTATDALKVLCVRPQTLYANVSRKKIRAKPDPKDTRRSLYHEADVRKMARQHGGQRKATAVAAAAIEWGDPILSSAISTVVDGRLYYRGKDTVVLSEEGTLEDVARLLWGGGRLDGGEGSGADRLSGGDRRNEADWLGGGDRRDEVDRFGGEVRRDDAGRHRRGGKRDGKDLRDDAAGSGVSPVSDGAKSSPLQRAFLALGVRAASDLSSYGRALPVLQEEAGTVLVTLADAMLEGDPTPHEFAGVARAKQERGSANFRRVFASHGRAASRRLLSDTPQAPHPHASGPPDDARVHHFPRVLHRRAVTSWNRPAAADIVRRALILLADHELNASTFATRVAVSTGAPLAAGVLSGLATLSGPLHGRASLGVLELVAGAKRAGADVTVRDWLSQGRPIVGFGHPLYSQGDPRATALLQQFTLPKPYADLRDAVEDIIGERPNIDFALAALTKVFDLPQEAPLVLFALGRCVGWLAHALEQVTTGHPIRPRARYVGPPIP